MNNRTIALVALVALAGVAGVVSAATISPWDGSKVSENVTINNDTDAIEVMAENITNGSADVTVSKWSSGTATQVANGTLTTNATTSNYTDSYRYDPKNFSASKYLVEVSGDGAASLSINAVNGTATTSGGGVLPSGNRGLGFLILAGVAVGFLYLNRR